MIKNILIGFGLIFCMIIIMTVPAEACGYDSVDVTWPSGGVK